MLDLMEAYAENGRFHSATVTIQPPIDGNETEEDSQAEDDAPEACYNHLSGNQLDAEAEAVIVTINEDQIETENIGIETDDAHLEVANSFVSKPRKWQKKFKMRDFQVCHFFHVY